MARVLLLEADKRLATSYRRALEQAGHEVHWQNDAQAALTVLDNHTPDVIVLEVHLAQHNGVEFLYEVRSYPDCDHIPVILHTMVPADHPGLGRNYWPQLGIKEYLYKPQTTLKQLVAWVNTLTAPQPT